jgi:adenine-specific DNA-methyltransferase
VGNSLHTVRFADPSLGTGSFFSAALSAFGADRIERAIGIEIDSTICATARDLWSGSAMEVVCADFTRIVADISRPSSPNLILANPPYVRHHHIAADDKKRLQALVYDMTGVEVSGLAGLYVYFLLLASAWMEEDGVAAWLVPSEFMDVNYGAALRQYLTEHVTLIRAHRFDPADVQFADALVSSVVLVFRNAIPRAGHAVEFSFGGTISKPKVREAIPGDCLRRSRKWTAFPDHAGNDRRTKTDDNGPSLGDLFRIQRGIATGSNKFFILDREDAQRRGLPSQYLKPILPSPRHLKTTIIQARADGYPEIEPQLCVIDCDLPEEILQRRHPALWQYLQGAEAFGIKEGYLIGKRSPWYKQERRAPAQFLCTYMGRSSGGKQPFRFILNHSQAIATNLYLILYPQGPLKDLLLREPTVADEVLALLQQVTGDELRGEGRVYGGGLNKIEPSELARVSAAALLDRLPSLAEPNEPEQGLFLL